MDSGVSLESKKKLESVCAQTSSDRAISEYMHRLACTITIVVMITSWNPIHLWPHTSFSFMIYLMPRWSEVKKKKETPKKVTEDNSPTWKSQKDEPVIPWLLCSKLRFKVCYALSRQKVDSIRPVTLPGVVHDIARTAPCPSSWSLRTMSSGCLLLVPWKFKFK